MGVKSKTREASQKVEMRIRVHKGRSKQRTKASQKKCECQGEGFQRWGAHQQVKGGEAKKTSP